jgi:hypothetical protein
MNTPVVRILTQIIESQSTPPLGAAGSMTDDLTQTRGFRGWAATHISYRSHFGIVGVVLMV